MNRLPPYLYEDADQARRAFAEAWVTGDGLHSAEAVAQAMEDLEDTAETVSKAASCLGDRNQAATTPEQWQQIICDVAMDYWRTWRCA